MSKIFKLVLLRHGQSTWNLENKFTGWADVGLSEKGEEECILAARILKKHGYAFDAAYTSVLKRAIRTTMLVLGEMGLKGIPVLKSWRLNERHYGGLIGLDKDDARKKHGEEQVFRWRRGYEERPPPVDKGSMYYPGNDPKYALLKETELPLAESLKDTVTRVIPYWDSEIAPAIKSGKRVLVSAHGNSLRALVKHIDSVPDSEIPGLEIPTGRPLVYELDSDLKPIKHYYLS